MKERKSSRLGWWLLLLLALLVGPFLIRNSRPLEDKDGRPIRAEPDRQFCSLHDGERRHLVVDKTGDGLVDCFYTIGFGGRGYRAADFDGRCTRKFFSATPMDDTMRSALNRILELRFEQGARDDHADDVDADDDVDCIRARPGGRVLVTFDGGRCEAGDEWTRTGDAEQQHTWNEILRYENQVRATVTESSG